jgi:transcriptional regulator with XRE-family HTH domain
MIGVIMDRFEFGALVASLRDDMRWTQLELAEKSGVDVAIISNIERGARRSLLKDNILVKLADGFRLTTLERQEFLFAASGVSDHVAIRKEPDTRPRFDSQTFIREIGEHVGRVTLPVFVTDSFCDVLLANHCLLEFYNVPRALMETANNGPGGYNQMRYVFHVDSNFREMIGEEKWDQFALINARYFRRRTLRVRSKLYFSSLLKELLDDKKYPSFERCWRRMVYESHDDFYTPFEEPNEDSDHNFVAVESLLALTPYGDLYLQQLLPLNTKTDKRMEKMIEKVGQGYVQLAPFPDKQKR